jgi:hypothetical protein
MGISTHYYTVYGVKVDYNEELNEAHYDVYDDSDTPDIIVYGMDCYHMILGAILYDSGNLRWNEYGDSFVEIDLSALPEVEAEYKKKFVNKFPDFASLVEGDFKLMTFVNYS